MKTSLFWFRRDLRLTDNAGLFRALQGSYPVRCIFIFDTEILDKLTNRSDARVTFIHRKLEAINKQLQSLGSGLDVYYGNPLKIWKELAQNPFLANVYTNSDYEPYARERDAQVANILHCRNIEFNTIKDHVIFEPWEVLKDDGSPYTVFTPFSKRWLQKLNGIAPDTYPSEQFMHKFKEGVVEQIMTLADIGFQESQITFPPETFYIETIKKYAQNRDFPDRPGTTKLGVHLRFGTVSIRSLVKEGLENSDKYLAELIWREFYQMIIYHFPKVNQSFKAEYDHILWRNNPDEFEAWKNGQTGYPIVDAGMRELLQTGNMHNRVRMVVASFLTKHLLIDWRWGEAWFAKHLLDFELASNNGGWQWAAGCGCDAAPYFRIFNPYLQTLKFDPDLKYIKTWVPELNSLNYPQPIVNHEFARNRVLEAYKEALGK